jgi:diguanylate cyclase (GGDEF)-like protein
MGADYVFVGVAFIIGLLCASVYQRVRNHLKQRSRPESRPTLVGLIRRLGAIQRPDELTAALLDELAAGLDCQSLALFLRDDVEFRLGAVRGFSDEQVNRLRDQLEAESNLSEPSSTTTVVHLDDGIDCALLALAEGREKGVLAVRPPAAMTGAAAREWIEPAAGYTLARLEAIRLEEELREAATQDAVTRLHNQRYFLELFELEYNRGARYERSLAVLLCGVDGLARGKQEKGTEISDAVLREVATAFRGSLRYFDVIGRYGSDIVAVLLPEAGGQVAARVAERLLKSTRRSMGGDSWTMNIGGACAGGPDSDYKLMLDSAAEALRQARESGDNRICMSLD